MDIPSHVLPPLPTRVNRRALTLAGVLLVLFVVAAGLYARFGYAVALRVYEELQLERAAQRHGADKIVELEYYLRADPASLRMRGLLINELIDLREAARALDVAKAGVAAAPRLKRPLANLLVARAQIAAGRISDATKTYDQALVDLDKSGEAHYGLAHIAAARGERDKMKDEFGLCKSSIFKNNGTYEIGPFTLIVFSSSNVSCNTPDFDNRVRQIPSAPEKSGLLDYLLVGDIDTVFARLASLENYDDAPAAALFWRGVYEEEQGHRDAALDFYTRAMDVGDALGKYAVGRLRRQQSNH